MYWYSHLILQVLSHVHAHSPPEVPYSWRLLQDVASCSSTARPHQVSQCRWARHQEVWRRASVGGGEPCAILQSQDRVFLSRQGCAEEPFPGGCLAQRVPEETPAPGGENSCGYLTVLTKSIWIHIGVNSLEESLICLNLFVYTSQAALSDLCAFGERVANEVDEWGRECEVTPPRLVHFDPWGRRVDHIVTSPAWKRMKDLSAQEGLVAIGYERPFGEWRLEACCTFPLSSYFSSVKFLFSSC